MSSGVPLWVVAIAATLPLLGAFFAFREVLRRRLAHVIVPAHSYFLLAQRQENLLTGKYANLANLRDCTPWAGRVVSSNRISGRWLFGRWEFAR